MANSRHDRELLAGVDRCHVLAIELASTLEVALDAYLEAPVWCGSVDRAQMRRVDPHTGRDTNQHLAYPRLDFFLAGEYPDAWEFDDVSGVEYHVRMIRSLIERARENFIPSEKQAERLWMRRIKNARFPTPLKHLDDIRALLRYQDILDHRHSILSIAFGLLRPEQVRDRYYGGIKRWEYLPLKDPFVSNPRLGLVLPLVCEQVRGIYDAASLALLNRKDGGPKVVLTERERRFITWMRDIGGSASNKDIGTWVLTEMHGLPSPRNPHHIDMSTGAALKRRFCDKAGKGNTRAPWVLRPEAIALLDGTSTSSDEV